jgi:hypothetical protein
MSTSQNFENADKEDFSRIFCIGLFLVTLSTMMYELLLTRIFSVTLWYHFAFMAVSLAMFGVTAGAMAVHVMPKLPFKQISIQCALFTLLYSLGVVCTFWLQVSIPFTIQFSSGWAIAATYGILAVPFFFGGVVVCLALTRASAAVSRVYAWDLAGAAIGCIALIALLEFVDGPTAVIWVSLLAAIGALLFVIDDGKIRKATEGQSNSSEQLPGRFAFLKPTVLAWLGIVLCLAISNPQLQLLKLSWSKGDESVRLLYEKWNSFSRIRVYGDPTVPQAPFGWGLSTELPADIKVRQLNLDIDAGAGTILTAFDGNLDSVRGLKYDITNAVYHLRTDANVLVIGAGGGRDILSALAFGEKSVTAQEINPNILDAVTRQFGDFTGHLDRNPKVTLNNNEGRCFLHQTDKKFDIIQLSLVDTFAATSAGAFTLTENSLYTQEAWALMFDKLTPEGIISATRWYTAEKPGEIYRLVSLGTQTLKDAGITDFRNHIVLLRLNRKPDASSPNGSGLGTMLLSKRPFSEEELKKLSELCTNLKFELVVSAKGCAEPVLAQLTSSGYEDAIKDSPLLIGPPTDDSPYFFQMIRLRDWYRLDLLANDRMISFYAIALLNLGILAILVSILTASFLGAPFFLKRLRPGAVRGLPFCFYFSTIGLAYIFIEMALIQKFQLFLGIPIYSLAVTLFTLLLTSSIGSFLSAVIERKHQGAGKWMFGALLSFCAIFGLTQTSIIHALAGAPLAERIAVAVAMICPLGLLMGMPFPLGMKHADKHAQDIKAWLWACNGAMSVFGSVAAVIIALSGGTSATFAAGFGAYCFAAALFLFIDRKKHVADQSS